MYPFTTPAPEPPPEPPPAPQGPIAPIQQRVISQVRSMVGDFAEPFRDVFTGGGELASYDLSQVNVATVTATILNMSTGVPQVIQNYSLDYQQGTIILAAPWAPLPSGFQLIVQGTGAGMFADADLLDFMTDAFAQHTYGRTIEIRYRDGDPSVGPQGPGYGSGSFGADYYGTTDENGGTGFIRYRYDPLTWYNLPLVEQYPLTLLSAMMVVWTLLMDSATDIDVSTAEGTFVPRTQRFRQLQVMYGMLEARYKDICAQLNVGLYRVEVFKLRRISRLTNRLVPVFKDREYDDPTLPIRILAPIDDADADQSGIPSPAWPGFWG